MQTRVTLVEGVSITIDFDKFEDKKFGRYLFKVILDSHSISEELAGMSSILKIVSNKYHSTETDEDKQEFLEFIKNQVYSNGLLFEYDPIDSEQSKEFYLELINKMNLCDAYSNLFALSNLKLNDIKYDEISSQIRINEYLDAKESEANNLK